MLKSKRRTIEPILLVSSSLRSFQIKDISANLDIFQAFDSQTNSSSQALIFYSAKAYHT